LRAGRIGVNPSLAYRITKSWKVEAPQRRRRRGAGGKHAQRIDLAAPLEDSVDPSVLLD